jgi:hypothetical protein
MKIARKPTHLTLIAKFIWNGQKHQKTYYGEMENIETVKKVVASHYKGATDIQVQMIDERQA